MQAVYTYLWRLLPGNPMVVRIVQGGSGRLGHLWLRMGYLGALVVLVVIGLLVGGGMGSDASLSKLASAGAMVFALVAYGQVVLVCLLAPLFMAGAIGAQQAGKTYDILLTTPLTNLQIVLGSLLGRLFFILLLLASGLPLFAVLLVFGGVPVASVFQAFAVAGSTALLVGAVAVTLSVFRAAGRKAVFVFVISIAAYLVAAYALDGVLLRGLPRFGGPASAPVTTWLTGLHPLLVLESSINSANYAPPAPEALPPTLLGPALLSWLPGGAWVDGVLRWYVTRPLAAYLTLTGLASGVMVGVCGVWVRRIGQGEARWVSGLKKKLRLSDNGGRTRKPRVVGRNPIAWRESHTRGKVAVAMVSRYGFLVVGLALALALLGAYHFDRLPMVAGFDAPGLFHAVLMTLLLLEVAVISLVAIYMSAGCVSKEREDGTLDIMLTTPITPKYYVWGKLQGLVRFLGLMIAAPVGTLLLAGLYSGVGYLLGWERATFHHAVHNHQLGTSIPHDPLLVSPEMGFLLILMLVPFVALCVAAGMGWSLKARGVLGAVVPTLGIMGAVAGVMGLCGFQSAQSIPYIGAVVNAFSPMTNLWMLVNPWDAVSGFAQNPIVGRGALIVAALICAGGYSLIVYALILGMVKGFDQTVRKLSGTG